MTRLDADLRGRVASGEITQDEGETLQRDRARRARLRRQRQQWEAANPECSACRRRHPLRVCEHCSVPTCPLPGMTSDLWACSSKTHAWVSRGLQPPLTRDDWAAYARFILAHGEGLADAVVRGSMDMPEAVGIITAEGRCAYPCDRHHPLTEDERQALLRALAATGL